MYLGVVSASFVYGYRIDQEFEIKGHFMLHASISENKENEQIVYNVVVMILNGHKMQRRKSVLNRDRVVCALFHP